MSHDEKLMSMRGNNPHFNRATVHHELIPGHHLQGFMTNRFNEHRGMFRTPFWGEGWALYWEMMLWENDFPRGPPRTASGCSSGACTGRPGSSSPSPSTWSA
jgi:hypothetical protein